MPEDANTYGIQHMFGELLTGYIVCPGGCEFLDVFNLRTMSEIARPVKCPRGCGNNLDHIPRQTDFSVV